MPPRASVLGHGVSRALALTAGMAAIALALSLIAGGAGAQASRSCGPHASIKDQLERKYQEHRVSGGIMNSGGVLVEVWASDETGSWTITTTDVRGWTCLQMAGFAFEDFADQKQGDPL